MYSYRMHIYSSRMHIPEKSPRTSISIPPELFTENGNGRLNPPKKCEVLLISSMRLVTLGAIQSLILSAHKGHPVLIDSATWGLDVAFLLTGPEKSTFPFASLLFLVDPYTAPVAVLSAFGFDKNSTPVQTLAVDVVPQLVRHESPDLLISLAVGACIQASRTDNETIATPLSLASILFCQFSSAEHNEYFAFMHAAIYLYRLNRAMCSIVVVLLLVSNQPAVEDTLRDISSFALFATEPFHSAVLRALPDILVAIRDWPPEIQEVVYDVMSDAVQTGDKMGNLILKSYMEFMQNKKGS